MLDVDASSRSTCDHLVPAGRTVLSEPSTARRSSDHALEPISAPGPRRVPSGLDPVLPRARVAAERQNMAFKQGFSVIEETGFEPATARPPAGAIEAHLLRFSALERFELL